MSFGDEIKKLLEANMPSDEELRMLYRFGGQENSLWDKEYNDRFNKPKAFKLELIKGGKYESKN